MSKFSLYFCTERLVGEFRLGTQFEPDILCCIFFFSCIILLSWMCLVEIHKGIFVASCNTTFLLSLQSKCSTQVKAAMTEAPEWTECHVTAFQLAKSGVWEPSPGSLGEKHCCQQRPERGKNGRSSSATLYCTPNTWENGVEFLLTVWFNYSLLQERK